MVIQDATEPTCTNKMATNMGYTLRLLQNEDVAILGGHFGLCRAQVHQNDLPNWLHLAVASRRRCSHFGGSCRPLSFDANTGCNLGGHFETLGFKRGLNDNPKRLHLRFDAKPDVASLGRHLVHLGSVEP